MATSQSSEKSGNLRPMLEEALSLYDKVDNSTEPTISETVQAEIKHGIELCEEATRMVSYAGVFSRNEGLSDLATADIPYLLLPVLLGRFTSQLVGIERTELIRITEVYYKDFLQRTNDYDLSDYVFVDESEDKKKKKKGRAPSVADACRERDMKLKQYDEKRKLKILVADLKNKLDGADDSTRREFYISLVKYFVLVAIEELKFLKSEKHMLEQMERFTREKCQPENRPRQKPLKPVIITKDIIQKAVYGAGYPSLPTMTVQEFYDKRVQDGVFPDPTKPRTGPLSLQEASLAGLSLEDEKEKELEEEDSKIDNDDEEYLKTRREQDEYKDDHRRGWGNRFNRS